MNAWYLLVLMMGLYISPMSQVAAAKLDVNPLGEYSIPTDTRCVINVSNSVINYGVQSRWQMEERSGQKVSPGKRTFTLSVVCPYSQTMRVILRGTSAYDGQLQYGTGGSVSLKILDAALDGKPIQLSLIENGIHKKIANDSLELRPDLGMMAMRDGDAVKGKNFTARVEVEPVLPEKEARVTSRQISEAIFSFELIK